jgi:hypothetical protein
VAHRSLVIFGAVARSPHGLWLPAAISIVVAEVQTKLIVRLATTPGWIALPNRLLIVVVETSAPLVFRFALVTAASRATLPITTIVIMVAWRPRIVGHLLAARSWRLAIPVAPFIVVVKPLPRRIDGFPIAARSWRLAIRVAPLILLVKTLSTRIVRLVVLSALWRLAVSLAIVVARSRVLAKLRFAIKIGGPPRFLVLLIGRLNDGIEPLPNRHAGLACSLTRGRTGFRMETSQIPGTARFHSHVQAT